MPSFAGRRELAGAKGLLGRIGYGAGVFTAPSWMPAIFNMGQTGSPLDKALRSIPSTKKTDAGRAAGNFLGNELRYIGNQLGQGSLPYLGNEMRYAAGEISKGRVPYSGPTKSPGSTGGGGGGNRGAGGSRSGGGGFTGGGSAAERAYQQEVARVAQLTAQDPELQRYEAARKIAAAQGASPEQVQAAEDIGMQIWQSKYGNTPMGQPGGAIGSYNPLMQRTFGYQTGQAPGQITEMQATAAPIPVAPGAIPYQQGDLGTRASSIGGYTTEAYNVPDAYANRNPVTGPVPIIPESLAYPSNDPALKMGYDPARYGLTPDVIERTKASLMKQAATK